MLSTVARYIPKPIKPPLRFVFFALADFVDALPGNRNTLTPPSYLRDYIGDGDFEETGQHFLKQHIELANLRPDERVLDVGCGIGRMAAALCNYLNENGTYDGFDVVKRGIIWCNRHIACKHPNFRFAHSDVYNKAFNPRGKIKAAEYRFSYPDDSFDYVFVYSVFTHMTVIDLENYVKEIARVLRPRGRCLITYFLLNAESQRSIERRTSSIDFKPYSKESWSVSLETPEFAIAYDETFITDLYRKYGLRVGPPVYFGSWSNRSNSIDFQDILVALKE